MVRLRAIISTLMLAAFAIVSLTGIGLYIAPSGRLAKETNWNIFGLDKWQLEKLHNFSGYLMIALSIIHLILNYKIYLNEIKILLKNN